VRRHETSHSTHAEQQTDIRRSENVARSLQAMAPQVSAYIRLSSPPTSIPGYIRLDASSEWSKSSLLCTAVETVTLPSRLREGNGRTSSLADLESALNRTGSRTLFELKASVVTVEGSGRPTPGKSSIMNESQGPLPPTLSTTFDLDFSPRGSQATLGRTPQRFSQVEVRRCRPGKQIPVELDGSNDQDVNVEM
jgi:hypothetical protein